MLFAALMYFLGRRVAGAVERGGLENRCTRTRTEGSNPSLSAIFILEFSGFGAGGSASTTARRLPLREFTG